jgi:hypothetical protein
MIEVRRTDTVAKVHQDYKSNFMPRKEIGLLLNYEEILELISNKEIQEQSWIGWHFQFYLKQLLRHSWEAIDKNISVAHAQKSEMMHKLRETTQFAKHNQTRALVAFLWVTFFIKEISDYDLYTIFNGHFIYDDHCAQVAYEEYLRRKSRLADFHKSL